MSSVMGKVIFPGSVVIDKSFSYDLQVIVSGGSESVKISILGFLNFNSKIRFNTKKLPI